MKGPIQTKRCLLCGYKIRGEDHQTGAHHLKALRTGQMKPKNKKGKRGNHR